ncbi:MAG: hypothetical protein HKL79_03655 [Thermoplasmata archaeon]|nr:hypothetical protein [Thermoplasmata archaeon]
MYRAADEDGEEIATLTRRFGLMEITSGLPDDSREADEREAERRLRELRGRVKAARALIASIPGLTETLARDWRKAAMFYARLGVTEAMVRHGVPSVNADGEGFAERVRSPVDRREEDMAREGATLP